MAKSKRITSLLLALVLLVTFSLPAMASNDTQYFTDISQSTYQEAIVSLHEMGVVSSAPDHLFRPEDKLTKAEATALLTRGFHLSKVQPIPAEDPTMEKSFTYTDPLQVIDDSFSIPSAADLVGHWGIQYVEGLIKVRAVEVEGKTFTPSTSVTKAEWSKMLANVIFGVDQSKDVVKAAVEAGFIDATVATSTEAITRAEAAGMLAKILNNPEFKVVTIFATSDIHGHLQPYTPRGAQHEIGALAKMSQVINEMRAYQPNTLLIDCGDAPYNTNITNLFEGASAIEVMNQMQYDAMAIGNHDFDFPLTVMERNAKTANFPFLSANTKYEGKTPSFIQPSVMKEIDGVKIAIVGITDDQSALYTHPRNVKGVTFDNEMEAAQKAVDQVRKEADVVIALAHLHGDNPVLPTKVNGIDIEIGGGQDVVGYPQLINDTYLISPGKHAELLNQINITMYQGKMVGLNFAPLFMTYNLPEDPAVKAIVDKYDEQLGNKMQEVVGTTTVELDGERQTARLKESNLANVIADSLRELTGADIALQNGGGVRASIDAGDITMAEVYATLPFDNTVVVVKATGKTIWAALENGVAQYPAAAGCFLQVSGLSYTFDASKEAGSRVVDVKVNGQPIDLEKTYTVVTNDFITGGGDGFTMMKEDTTLQLTTKHYLRDAFVEYLQKHTNMAPQNEGRITILNEATPEAK